MVVGCDVPDLAQEGRADGVNLTRLHWSESSVDDATRFGHPELGGVTDCWLFGLGRAVWAMVTC
jgi:hypothetical protein